MLSDDEYTLMEKLESKRVEHRALDETIGQITQIGSVDNLRLQRLKKRKLQLKEEIAHIESILYPDIIA